MDNIKSVSKNDRLNKITFCAIINKEGDHVNNPILIIEDDFSFAWAKALIKLKEHSWDAWNFVVTINNPDIENSNAIELLTDFAKKRKLNRSFSSSAYNFSKSFL